MNNNQTIAHHRTFTIFYKPNSYNKVNFLVYNCQAVFDTTFFLELLQSLNDFVSSNASSFFNYYMYITN